MNMTAKQLNRDIQKLYKQFFDDSVSWGTLKDEYLRLYYADSSAEHITLNSLKAMIRINHSARFIPLHQLYITARPDWYKTLNQHRKQRREYRLDK